MQQPSGGITPLDDVLRISGDTTVDELLASPLLCQEAPAVAQGLALDRQAGLLAGSETAADLLRQDLLCPCRGQGEPCLRDGGSTCPAIREGGPAEVSVLGGRSPASPRCQAVCPLSADLPGILQLLREGSLLEARRTLMKYLPMADTVCQACGRCTGGCVRSAEDAPVAVHRIIHWMGQTISAQPEIFFVPPRGDSRKWIALAHPTLASLAAAYYLRRMGNHVVVFRDKPAADVLAPYGAELAGVMAGPLETYRQNLAHMGVEFTPDSPDAPADRPAFALTLDLQGPGSHDLEDVLDSIRQGREEARRINLDFGLKSFLEPGGDFCTFDRYGLTQPPADWQAADQQAAALREASRCLNCSCLGGAASSACTALYMLETALVTDRRTIRAQDYFAQITPWQTFQPGETPAALEIPMSGDFHSGCLRQGEITLSYAFLLAGGRVQIARLVFGGIAPVPVRLAQGERRLEHREITALDPQADAAAVLETIRPQLCPTANNTEKPAAMETLLRQCLAGLPRG